MDYSGLINLALVTIIYSTFIAPNLQKLGQIREEIADINFPLKGSSTEDSKEIEENGLVLDKKLTQYTDKYTQVSKFLRYFYTVIVLLLATQVVLLVHSGKYYFANVIALITVAIVVILLIMTLRVHMTKPWRVRSIGWLARAGIAPVYIYDLFKPELAINNNKSNIVLKDKLTRISLLNHIDFVGYRYVLTIESPDGNRLYYVSAGQIMKYLPSGAVVYDKGLRINETYIGIANLKPSDYIVRLLIFSDPFGGTIKASETLQEFSVNESETPRIVPKKIVLDNPHRNDHYQIETAGGKVKRIEINEDFANSTSMVMLFSSRSFRRLFRKDARPFSIDSYYGTLTKSEISKFTSRRNYTWKTINRCRRRPSKRSSLLKLVSRKKY